MVKGAGYEWLPECHKTIFALALDAVRLGPKS